MDSGEEEYQGLPEKKSPGEIQAPHSLFFSSLRVNHHHIQAKEDPIQ